MNKMIQRCVFVMICTCWRLLLGSPIMMPRSEMAPPGSQQFPKPFLNYTMPATVYLDMRTDAFEDTRDFKVALITAGSIRSFLYNERSWQRYILDPWKDNIYVFAQ